MSHCQTDRALPKHIFNKNKSFSIIIYQAFFFDFSASLPIQIVIITARMVTKNAYAQIPEEARKYKGPPSANKDFMASFQARAAIYPNAAVISAANFSITSSFNKTPPFNKITYI